MANLDNRRKALEDEYFRRQEVKNTETKETEPDQPTLADRIEFANNNRYETPKVNHGSTMGYAYAITTVTLAIAAIIAVAVITFV